MENKKVIFITGRSSCGKNTFANKLLENDKFEEMIMHTTRPRRTPNESGYIFDSDEEFEEIKKNNGFVETRTYNTNKGIWKYGTAKENILEVLEKGTIPVITSGTPEMYRNIIGILNDMGIEVIVCFLKVDEKELLTRAMNREMTRENPDYVEMCRRFIADSKDYNEENIAMFPKNAFYEEKTTEENLAKFLKTNNL